MAATAAPPAPPQTDAPPPPPKFGTGKLADPTGQLPRVVEELERAPGGQVRFKCEARNYEAVPTLYVLAKNDAEAEAQAKACYLKASTLEAQMQRVEKAAGKKNVAEPVVVMTRLSD